MPKQRISAKNVGEQALARAVISLAKQDAIGHKVIAVNCGKQGKYQQTYKQDAIDSARLFLTDWNGMYGFWKEVAGYD